MKKIVLTCAFSLLLVSQTHAAVTVLGSAEGQECYFSASNDFSTSGISACNQALRSGNLDRQETAGTYINRGILYLRMREFDKAFDDFQSALEIVPDMPEAFVNRGNVYFHRGNYNAALRDYTAAIDGGTKQPYAAHYNRGLVYERLGQTDKAIEDFQAAVALRPNWDQPLQKLVKYGVAPATN